MAFMFECSEHPNDYLEHKSKFYAAKTKKRLRFCTKFLIGKKMNSRMICITF